MGDVVTFALTVFMGFFAIMNPISNTPIFLGLVEDETDKSKKEIARTATITAFAIVACFIVAGKFIFELFGLTIPAFKITGGILIFYVGFQMLMSKDSKMHSSKNLEANSSIAISPLAIPILAGPGTIVTAMNYTTHADFLHIGIVIGIFAIMILLTYLAFVLSDLIVEKVGENLIAVIGKLMGLILAVIGTGMVVEGVKLSFNLS